MKDSPALDWITIKGFKSISCIKCLKLNPINVLIGSNGSGKSNFLEAFFFLNAIRSGHLRHYVQRAGGANNLLHFGVKNTQNLTLRVSIKNEINQYEIQLSIDDFDNLFPFEETLYCWNKSNYDRPYEENISGKNGEAGISVIRNQGISGYIQDTLDSWRSYHFHDTSRTSPLN